MWCLRLFFSLLVLVVHSPGPAHGEKLSGVGTESSNLFTEFIHIASNGSCRWETTISARADDLIAKPFSFGSIWCEKVIPDSITYLDYHSGLLRPKIGFDNDSGYEGDEYADSSSRKRILQARHYNSCPLNLYDPGPTCVAKASDFSGELGNKMTSHSPRLHDEIEQYEPRRILGKGIGCFASVNVESYEDSNWRDDMTLHVGLVFPNPKARTTWRLGFEFGNSRSALGEFFGQREQHFAVGLWVGF